MMKADARPAGPSPWWRRFGVSVLDALYPRSCQGCEALLPAAAPRTGLEAWLCPDCREALEPVREPRCAVCGEPFDGAMTGPFTCSNCSGRRIAFDFAVAGALAAGPVREMIHRFKYQRDLSRRGALAELLRLALTDPRLAALDPARWLLVPVPLHPLRQLWRGFNQSWELARTLAALTGLPARPVLRRRQWTRTQARLDRRRRLANLRGAFALRRAEPALRGRCILLVDDVLTTGATAHECARVLKGQAGVEKVVVITAARG